jgi:uncharacterized protein (DUF362 family)
LIDVAGLTFEIGDWRLDVVGWGDGIQHTVDIDRKSRVALIQGDDRYGNIAQALDKIDADVDLSGKRHVLVKPNFVVTHLPLAATHLDAVRAVLDFVRARHDGPVTVAEGPSTQKAIEGFRAYGYEPLTKAYDATLLDLNHDEPRPVEVYDWRLRPLRLHMARSVLESDFRISVSLPKTHDAAIVTLSLKNMVMGGLISRFTHAGLGKNKGRLNLEVVKKALWRMVPRQVRYLPLTEWMQFRAMSYLEPSDKMKMHQSYPVINLNLALLARQVVPHLAVIDAFEAMEGNGPTHGTPVPMHLALVSTDALAADVVGTTLMGFDADEVGYLHYCKKMGLGTGDLERIEIVGNATLAESTWQFRPHDTYHRQIRWQLPQAEHYLRCESARA